MDELYQIIENSKVTKETIKDSLILPALQTADYKPRVIFEEISEISDNYFTTYRDARMIGLAGLRGTGKTTLLWQTALHIWEKYCQEIYFFNIADLKSYNIGVKEIHRAFENIAKSKLWSYKKQVVLLFDEVHEDPQWARALKVLYDEFKTSFIMATGSSALLLQSTADLVTRMYMHHVFPLSLPEFLNITNADTAQKFAKENEFKEILFYSGNVNILYDKLQEIENFADEYYSKVKDINEHISDYILYRNITRFSLLTSKSRINSFLTDLIRRVIYEDIPKMTDKINVHFSEKILRRIAASDEINLQTLSQAIGISQQEINDNLDILVKAELLNVLYPFGGIDTKINKSHKYFFMSPSIRRVLLSPIIGAKGDDDIYAKLLEDIVVLYLKRLFKQDSVLSFSSQKGNRNPDLIIETLPEPIIIEIGIGKKTSKQISKSKIKYKYGIIINSKAQEITINEQEKTVILPLKYFLLL